MNEAFKNGAWSFETRVPSIRIDYHRMSMILQETRYLLTAMAFTVKFADTLHQYQQSSLLSTQIDMQKECMIRLKMEN